MEDDIFDPYDEPHEDGQVIPQITVEEFWYNHADEYDSKTLREAVKLADDAWFEAKDNEILGNLEDEEDTSEEIETDLDNFTPISDYQQFLTLAFLEELNLGLDESTKLASDLMKRYDPQASETVIEVENDEYRL